MKETKNRDMMAKLYRLVEKYETPQAMKYEDEAVSYFREALKDCQSLEKEFPDSAFAVRFAVALYTIIEDQFKTVNKMPLEESPEQKTILEG